MNTLNSLNPRILSGLAIAVMMHIFIILKIANFHNYNDQMLNNVGDNFSLNISYYNQIAKKTETNTQDDKITKKVNQKLAERINQPIVKENISSKNQENLINKNDISQTQTQKFDEDHFNNFSKNNLEIPTTKTFSTKGHRSLPIYPDRALKLNQQAIVYIKVLLNESGISEKIEFSQKSVYPLLNKAAINAVKKWHFNPVIVKGRAIKSWIEIPIEFKIS